MGRGKRPSLGVAVGDEALDLGARWAERFFDTFARASFRRLSQAEKQRVYQRMAGELVPEISRARPEWDSEDNRSWWAAILKARFSGNDFWMLSADGKRSHCRNVGQEVALCASIVTTQGVLGARVEPGRRSRPSSLAG